MRSHARLVTLVLAVGLIGTAIAEEPRPSADLQGEKILHCYRQTARFEKAVAITEADVLAKGHFDRSPEPHDRRALTERYGEASISYLRIYWRGGISGVPRL